MPKILSLGVRVGAKAKIVEVGKTMGTLPVFMTAVSTILGAILFLKFGYALGHVGLFGTLAIILIGHLVTVPTAMAVAEIATNQKVEGGGAYYIISRSFGLNIGGAIGIALFLAQAISIAFYVIAFTEALEPVRQWVMVEYGKEIFKETITFTTMGLLSLLILTRGANVGVKALYVVVAILVVALGAFFIGNGGDYDSAYGWRDTIADVPVPEGKSPLEPDSFFYVFAIIFPAFTGIAAGLGLSGDLKDPKKSIPRGTLWATVAGILVYIAVAFKLHYSASPTALANEESIVMGVIAGDWEFMIYVGLACAAISSALGSIMIAPRTLQALAVDKVFPGPSVNDFLGKGRKKDNEPINASIITCAIGFFFCSLGDINAVAEIISMFFMVTYGAICMVSFFEHFAADPSYRPTFKSRWWLSLLGGLLCFWLMFKMNTQFAFLAIAMMTGLYVWITRTSTEKSGMANLFKGVIFQISRTLQIFLQRRDQEVADQNWRPFIICISQDSFKRAGAFSMVSWISHKYGFGTYMHFIEGYLSDATRKKSGEVKGRLINLASGVKSRVYLDTIISPSYTSAIAQAVQLPGISGKGNNMILFEYSVTERNNLQHIAENYNILKSTELDICVLQTSYKGFGFKQSINIWITTTDAENGNLMILLGYIILGHPDWKEAEIKIFSLYDEDELVSKKDRLESLVETGRLPISMNNIELIRQEKGSDYKQMINEYSEDADLTVIGFDDEDIEAQGIELFEGYDNLGNILFVNAHDYKKLD